MRTLILCCLLLTGCATPEERAERDMQAFGPYCDKLGYSPASDAWRSCIQQQATQRSARAAAAAAQGQAAGNAVRDSFQKAVK